MKKPFSGLVWYCDVEDCTFGPMIEEPKMCEWCGKHLCKQHSRCTHIVVDIGGVAARKTVHTCTWCVTSQDLHAALRAAVDVTRRRHLYSEGDGES